MIAVSFFCPSLHCENKNIVALFTFSPNYQNVYFYQKLNDAIY